MIATTSCAIVEELEEKLIFTNNDFALTQDIAAQDHCWLNSSSIIKSLTRMLVQAISPLPRLDNLKYLFR
jgi:hypothetical protein